MNGADLAAELITAQRSITSTDRRLLLAAGVSPLVLDIGFVGLARVTGAAGLYEPLPEGRPAYITPVRVADPAMPEWTDPAEAIWLGDLVDLVAWRLDRPERWALRLGNAQWLGSIEPQYLNPPPVAIRSTPLSWLAAGATGLAILTRNACEARRLLLGCRSIVAEDQRQARELRRWLERPLVTPPISIASARGQRVAA